MNGVWNLPEDGEEELPETEGSPEEASEREGSLPSEQRSAVDSTRRTDEARRQNEEPFEGEEKRQEPERRSEEERRGISYDVTCKTSGSTSRRKNENPSLLWSCFHRGPDGASGDWLFVVRHREVFPRRRQDRL